MLGKNLITAAAGNAGSGVLGVEDVFSTWLYTGNGSTQTITNGIDLSGEGGLVWIKRRDSTPDHHLYDTARPIGRYLSSNNINSQGGDSFYGVTSYTNSGFVLSGGFEAPFNFLNGTYASWTFRKAEKFFDVVTYTGTGSNRTIAHNLGSVPGCIIVKTVGSVDNWAVYHRSLGATKRLWLNLDSAESTGSTFWNNTEPTSSVFSVGTNGATNGSGLTYVAYVFAHDAGGFGDDGTESVIKCGSFTTDGSGNATVDLGWEPQWLLWKSSSNAQNWYIHDNMRGLGVFTAQALYPNLANAEAGYSAIQTTSTGFTCSDNASRTYIYIAIRRGPMKRPTDATKVFNAAIATTVSPTTTFTPGFPADSLWVGFRANPISPRTHDRLRGSFYLQTASTAAEAAVTVNWDQQNNLGLSSGSGLSIVDYEFRRAPGFFDVVAYTGTSVARTVNHNLGVAPELMIVKRRSTTRNWLVYHSALGNTKGAFLNLDIVPNTFTGYWNDTSPTSSVFSLGNGFDTNSSGDTYIAYLFATCPGVSKVGSYTGTGTTLDINCGFTSGARFVLIKRTDSTGDWYVWDTARGIVSGNDPYLLLNSAAAEVTSTDYIDPLSSGFQISSTAPAAINANGGSFIFLAIA